MSEVHFFDQPRPVQERFVNATYGTGVPRPLLYVPYHNQKPLAWRLASALAFLCALLVAALGFGKLESSIGIAPVSMIVVYGAFLGVAVGALLHAFGMSERTARLPYRPGIYVFPSGLIDARVPRFRVIGLRELAGARHTGGKLELAFSGGRSFAFPVGDKAQAEAVERALSDAQAQLTQAEAVNDWRTLAGLDPLRDNGFSNPFSANEPLTQKTPLFGKLPVVLGAAVVAGLCLGWVLWAARNWRSEEHLFSKARHLDTAEGYKAYLARGGQRPEVAAVLLPRAELRQVLETGTVEAIERFRESHKDSQIAGEIAAALRAQLVRELNVAAATANLDALRKFKQDFPRHAPVAGELQRYMDGVRDVAVAKFKRVARDSGDVEEFFEKLIHHTAAHGPKVVLRFMRLPSDSLEPTDRAIKRSTYYGGNYMLPSQYFSPEYTARREERTAKAIIERLSQAFTPDIVRFEQGPIVEGEELPTPDVPTLFIQERVQLSGAFLSRKPRGAWAGAGVLFRAVFRIPGEKQEFELKHSTWRPPNPLVLLKPDAKTEDLYEDMASTAYERFTKKFLATVLDEP